MTEQKCANCEYHYNKKEDGWGACDANSVYGDEVRYEVQTLAHPADDNVVVFLITHENWFCKNFEAKQCS